jgi:hypothetical protein
MLYFLVATNRSLDSPDYDNDFPGILDHKPIGNWINYSSVHARGKSSL